MDITIMALALVLGIVFGFAIQRMGFCMATGFAEIFEGKGRRIMLILLIIFMIEVILFHVIGGTRAIGVIRGHGFYNVLSGFLFGLGFMITGSCVLGTLYKLGEGQMGNLLIPVGWVIGMAMVVYGINPYLTDVYNQTQVLLPEIMKLGAWEIVIPLTLMAAIWAYFINNE